MLPLGLLVAVLAVGLNGQLISSGLTQFCKDRFCGFNAACNPKTGSCECQPATPLGNRLFKCDDDSVSRCVVIGDPHIEGFNRAEELSAKFVGVYSLAQFETSLNVQLGLSSPLFGIKQRFELDILKNRCGVQVAGINSVSPHGTSYLAGVSVSLSVKVLDRSIFTVQFVLDNTGLRVGFPGLPLIPVSKLNKLNGLVCTLKEIFGSNLVHSACYQPEVKAWEVRVPACGELNFIFREWEEGHENQLHRPGLYISAKKTSIRFSDSESSFPQTLCGSADDQPDAVKVRCQGLNLSKSLCVLWAGLRFAPTAQPSGILTKTVTSFQKLSAKLSLSVVNQCGLIYTAHAQCVREKGSLLEDVFQQCLDDVENGRSINASVTNQLRGTGPGCLPLVVVPRLPLPIKAQFA